MDEVCSMKFARLVASIVAAAVVLTAGSALAADHVTYSKVVGAYEWVASGWIQYHLARCGMQQSAHFHADSWDSTGNYYRNIETISASGVETVPEDDTPINLGTVTLNNAAWAYIDGAQVGAIMSATGTFSFQKTNTGSWGTTTYVRPCIIWPGSAKLLDREQISRAAAEIVATDPATAKELAVAGIKVSDLSVSSIELSKQSATVTVGDAKLTVDKPEDIWVVSYEYLTEKATTKVVVYLESDGNPVAVSASTGAM